LTNGVWLQSTGAAPVDQWTHVAVTYDTAAGGTVKFYINGVLDSTHTATGGVIVAGYSWSPMLEGMTNTGTGSDVYVAKFSGAGTPLWSRLWGSATTDQLNDMALDEA